MSVLKNTYIHFINRTRVKKLELSYMSPDFETFANNIADHGSGMMSWLGVFISNSVNSQGKEVLSISINLVDSAP